jgi:uncharacterized membrane-anchored protein
MYNKHPNLVTGIRIGGVGVNIRHWLRYGAVGPVDEPLNDRLNPKSFKDWRDGRYPERNFMIKETHARTGYPLPRYARVSHMTRIFPSREDEFRRNLIHKLRPQDASDLEISLAGKVPGQRREAAQKWFDTLAGPINALGLNHSEDEASQERFIKTLGEALSQMRGAPTKSSRETRRDGALDVIADLDGLFDEAGPLHASDADIGAIQQMHPSAERQHFRPYKPTGQARFRWYNFWRLDGAPSPERRLRVNWELFGASQNFTVYEDFRANAADFTESLAARLPPSPADRPRAFLLPAVPETGPEDPNLEWTALDSLELELNAISQSQNKLEFKWTGNLLVAAHYWIMPINHSLSSLEAEKRDAIITGLRASQGREHLSLGPGETLALAEALEELAVRLFRYPDKTAYGEFRKDFVISRISNGQAILISDLRPTDRSAARGEMASQAIILDIALTSEERGRVVRRCADIASARTLAFRDFPYVDAVTSAINGIGRSLDQCNSEILDVAHRGSADLWRKNEAGADLNLQISDADVRKDLGVTLKRLRQLAVNLSTLNAFITHGVSGGQVASHDYRELVKAHSKSLSESPIGGFQTLDAFLSRFFSTADSIDRMAVRYDTLRRRVAEYSQLVRTEIELQELKQLQGQAGEQVALLRRADILGAVGVFLGLLTVFTSDASTQEPLSSLGYAIIAAGAVGSLTVLHAVWKTIRQSPILPKSLRLFIGLSGFVGFGIWALDRLA